MSTDLDFDREETTLLMKLLRAQLVERVWEAFRTDPARMERVMEAIVARIVSNPQVSREFEQAVVQRCLSLPEFKGAIEAEITKRLQDQLPALSARIATEATARLARGGSLY